MHLTPAALLCNILLLLAPLPDFTQAQAPTRFGQELRSFQPVQFPKMPMGYSLHGNGKQKVLVLPGGGCMDELWADQIYLMNRDGGYEVCFCSSDSYSAFAMWKKPQAVAVDIAELLEHLKWSQVHVIGASHGGLLALRLALHCSAHSDVSVRSLILCASHAGGIASLPPLSLGLLRCVWQLMPCVPGSRVSAAMSLLCSERVCNDPDRFSHLLQHLHDASIKLDHFFKAPGHPISHQSLKQLAQSTIRSVVLSPSADRVVRPTNSDALSRCLGASLKTFKGAGHAVFAELPEEFFQCMHEFIFKDITSSESHT